MLQQDMALVEKWRARRDADAFALIVQRHAALVYATSLRITRNRADAEDIAQECFASLALGKTRIKSSLASWLHKVATHRSLDRLRSDTRRKAREQRSPETESPSDEVSWNDIQSYVDQALAELPEKLRFPLIAHFLEGESYQSIAATLDLPRSTVASRVRKGLELVRQSLERRGVRATAACLNALLAANAIKAVPSALAAALGKYAIAGAGKASVAVGAQSLVGWVLWQKIAVVASLAVALAFGTWTVANYAIDGEAPPRETSAVSAGTADDAAVDLPQEAKEVVSVRETGQAEAEDPAEPTGTPPEATVAVDEPETGGTITGRMYDAETNEPVEGAIAYAYPRRGGSSEGRSARSDAEGRYRITGLADGWYSISPARVAGYPRQSSEMRRMVKVTTDGPVEDVDFAYHPGIRVAGIITSAGGQPMPEVRVGAMVESAGHAENARSQSDGSFEVFVLPRGDRLPKSTLTLFLQAQTSQLESELLGPLALTRDGVEGLVVPLVRVRKSSISGTVVDPGGRPLEGVGVRLSRGESDYLVGSGSSRSDAEGQFSISQLAADTYAILLMAPGTSVVSLDDQVLRSDLKEGESLTDLRLVFGEDKGGLAITGRVIDTSGKPIALVDISAQGGTVRQKARSGGDGRFRITGLTEGRYFISAHHVDEHANAVRYSPAQLPGVRAGSEAVDIVLHGQAGVEGRVIRADTGEPVTEFEVFYVNHAANGFSTALLLNGRQISQAEGHFALTALYVGDATITVRAPGLAPSFKVLSLVEHETTSDVEIGLDPAVRFNGTVVAADGTPVADAMIFLGKIPDMGIESKRVARTEADGSFSIDSFSPDAKIVTAYHPDHGPGSVDVSKGTIIILPAAGRIHGKVTFRGEASSKVFVRGIYPDRWYLPSPSSTVAKDGGYELTELAPGKIRIWARHESGVRLERDVEIDAGGTRVEDLDFEAGTSVVEGSITIVGAAPTEARVALSVLTGSGKMSFGQVARAGAFRLEKLPVGQAVLKVSAKAQEGGTRARSVTIEIKEGEVFRTDVDFSGQGHLTGRVLGLSEGSHGTVLLLQGQVLIPKEPADLLVQLNKLERFVLSQNQCASDGKFHVDGLEPGTYTVLAVMMPKGGMDPAAARIDSALVKLGKAESLSLELDVR